jgi:hypothetical protein
MLMTIVIKVAAPLSLRSDARHGVSCCCSRDRLVLFARVDHRSDG